MTFDELVQKITEILPDAVLGEDNNGQIVVYTGLRMIAEQNDLVDYKVEGD